MATEASAPVTNLEGGDNVTLTPSYGRGTYTIDVGPVVEEAVAGPGISVSPGTGTVTISNTGVLSNVAGTGISVSGATGNVTITNAGATSIVAGTGIAVSGPTGAVTVSSNVDTATGNVHVGAGSLAGVGSKVGDTAVGSTALAATTTGGFNTAVGNAALEANTTGGDNTAVGYQANQALTGAVNATTAVGSGAVATANFAIAIGASAASNTANLAVIGTPATAVSVGDPGGGAGAWQLGKRIIAGVTADTTRYLEVTVDGVVYKVIIST